MNNGMLHHHHRNAPRAGDWLCPNGCGNVYASKTKCFRCGVHKPEQAKVLSEADVPNNRRGNGFRHNPGFGFFQRELAGVSDDCHGGGAATSPHQQHNQNGTTEEKGERIKEAKEPTKERKIIILMLKENNNIRVLIID